MCFEKECIMTLQDHPRSLITGTNRKRIMTSYSTSIGPILPPFRYIRAFVRQKPLFSAPQPNSGENFGVFPLEQTRHVRVAKSERPRLTNGEVIFEEFQPMWSQFTNVTDRQTDRRHAIAIPRFALKCIARWKTIRWVGSPTRVLNSFFYFC